ncbi:PTS sugar transporter subunit IIB [Brevibacillus sp. SYP-B805]|uniref:PTS sugar transporter subunit IIB n=1 Tax=Brevibacillus sp. SYP-B805 TaxID=1578199 RepID=UPI0013ED8D5E|nr:PTS sugar transporter subunit IIB [Brevibacillus sp. SYP-B805]NGQ95763.1 PTS sugar transporter subunit IIB [Brevibacillus sp. SYP-B805]
MFIRIDDRLVHGQVVTAWLRQLKAKTIVVADDTAAKNTMIRKALQLATPRGVNLLVLSVEEAGQQVASLPQDDVILLVKSPITAKTIISAAPAEMKWKVNVGNVGKAEGREKYASTVYLDQENYQALKELADKGVDVFYQMVPTDQVSYFRE